MKHNFVGHFVCRFVVSLFALALIAWQARAENHVIDTEKPPKTYYLRRGDTMQLAGIAPGSRKGFILFRVGATVVTKSPVNGGDRWQVTFDPAKTIDGSLMLYVYYATPGQDRKSVV